MIAFLLLAHENPGRIAEFIDDLALPDNLVFCHLDASSGIGEHEIAGRVSDDARGRLTIIPSRRVAWGEYSIVDATLRLLRAVAASGVAPTHAYLVSGADFVVRPMRELADFLGATHQDFIEAHHHSVQWCGPGGLQNERYRRYFFYNARSQPELFAKSLSWQIANTVERPLPAGTVPYLGSQWWTLRWATCLKILALLESRADIEAFFRTTFIPDEMFFQTLVRMVSPDDELSAPLTFAKFAPGGKPLVFRDGGEGSAFRDCYLARKLDPGAMILRNWSRERARA
jgi:hypothetical protein